MKCAVDETDHATLEDLHRHVRFKLKLTQEEYYQAFAPRRDLLTGEIIPFKRPVERYLQSEFCNKNNLKKWCKMYPDKGRKWAIDWLRKRKEEKNLVYPPTQVELRSLMSPSIHYYETIGGYHKICADLGFTIRFGGDVADKSLPSHHTVMIDTRENDPLEIAHANIEATVRCGDYGIAAPNDRGVYIERKSLNDLVGTLSDRVINRRGGDDSNLERFTRELERAEEMGAYIVLLCEADINQALGFHFLPQFKRVRVTVDHIFKNLRDLLHRFSCFQALFVNDRDEAAAAVIKLLAMGRDVERLDLQYLYESGRIRFD